MMSDKSSADILDTFIYNSKLFFFLACISICCRTLAQCYLLLVKDHAVFGPVPWSVGSIYIFHDLAGAVWISKDLLFEGQCF